MTAAPPPSAPDSHRHLWQAAALATQAGETATVYGLTQRRTPTGWETP